MPVYLSRNVPPTAYESIAICHCFRHEAQICLVAATASWRLSFWSQRTLRSVAGAVFRPVGSSLSGGRLLPAIRTQSPRASRSRPANRTRYARSGRDRENQGRALWVRPPVAYISWQNVLPERRGGMTRKPVVVPALMTHAPSPNRDEIAGRIAIGLGTLADLSLVHRFVFLCFTNRSGSAYLGDILSSTGYFLPAGESFNAVEVLAACQERGLRSFNEYFSYIVRRDTRSNTYIVKVAPEQILLLIHSGILDQIIDRSAFLFLRRADELAQAVSQAIAEQNNHWTWDLPKSVPDDKLVYSSKRISELLYFISYSNQCFEQFFSYSGIVPINVEYERVISQPQQELYEIVRRLGLPSLGADLSRLRYQRQSNEINQAWRTRFLSETEAPTGTSFGEPRPQAAEIAVIPQPVAPRTGRIVQAAIVAHIRNVGDVTGDCGVWIGKPNSGLWIEGFSITPRQGLAPHDIEYQAGELFEPVRPWVSGGGYCGTRGLSTPLRNLRVRLRQGVSEAYHCVYTALFLDGSTFGPVQAGQLCQSASLAPLEAFQLLIVPHQPEARHAESVIAAKPS